MGNQIKKIRVPKYVRDFNLEKRVEKSLEIDHTHRVSPRHPSTVERFKKIEETAPNVDESRKNLEVEERSKNINVKSKLASDSAPKHMADKRPSKEREEARWLGLSADQVKRDVDFEKYGYAQPQKIRAGCLSLRQFDEFLIEIKSSRTPADEVIRRRADESKIDTAELRTLLEYYKPLYRVDKNQQDETEHVPIIDQVFTNVKKLEK